MSTHHLSEPGAQRLYQCSPLKPSTLRLRRGEYLLNVVIKYVKTHPIQRENLVTESPWFLVYKRFWNIYCTLKWSLQAFVAIQRDAMLFIPIPRGEGNRPPTAGQFAAAPQTQQWKTSLKREEGKLFVNHCHPQDSLASLVAANQIKFPGVQFRHSFVWAGCLLMHQKPKYSNFRPIWDH